MFRRGVVLASLIVLVACGGGTLPGTGIRGVVMLGPACPVENINSPCPDRPFQGDVVATAADGSTTTTTTDDQGRFTIDLVPGTYTVVAVTSGNGVPPTPIPQNVVVRDRAYTQVTLEVDTGIR